MRTFFVAGMLVAVAGCSSRLPTSSSVAAETESDAGADAMAAATNSDAGADASGALADAAPAQAGDAAPEIHPNAPGCPTAFGVGEGSACPVTDSTCDYPEGRCGCVRCSHGTLPNRARHQLALPAVVERRTALPGARAGGRNRLHGRGRRVRLRPMLRRPLPRRGGALLWGRVEI